MQRHRLSIVCLGTLLVGAACGLALLSAQQPAVASREQELVVEKLRPN